MKKLFVIGNGFDCAHNLPTSYEEFKRFLCDTYMNGKCENDSMPIVPAVTIGPKGEEICNMEEVANFLVYIISVSEPNGDKWNELETSLGRLNYDEIFDILIDEYDEDGDPDYWTEVYNNEDMAANLYAVIPYVKKFFSEWIETIDINSAKLNRQFNEMIELEDIFLNFNYTETLEKIYEVESEKICHIHGKKGEELFFGHGNDEDYTEEYMIRNIGSENYLTDLDEFLKKDTKQAFQNNQHFFNCIDKNVKEIYSMGFSFGDVDLIYIKEICKRVSDDTVWYLNDFNQSEIDGFQKKLRECGFRGEIKTFHI